MAVVLMLVGRVMRMMMLNLVLELMSACVLMLVVMLMVGALIFIVHAEDEIVNPWPELRPDEVRKSVGATRQTSKHERHWPSPRLWDDSHWHACAPHPICRAPEAKLK